MNPNSGILSHTLTYNDPKPISGLNLLHLRVSSVQCPNLLLSKETLNGDFTVSTTILRIICPKCHSAGWEWKPYSEMFLVHINV
jgi:hypothetical protein